MSRPSNAGKFVYDRLSPKQNPAQALWALKANIYWMRALAIVIETDGFTHPELTEFYAHVQPRHPSSDTADNKAFGSLLMAQHYQAALQTFAANNDGDPFILSRSAIVTWYYVIYEASIAMVNAQKEEQIETHARLMNTWHTAIIKRSKPLAVGPFAPRFDTLVKDETDTIIKTLRDGRSFKLVTMPTDLDEAWGAICAYLNGTGKRDREKIEAGIKEDFNMQRINTRIARQARDKALAKKRINFLHEAFRYRGKANYRDSLYLSYGATDVHLAKDKTDEDIMREYLTDLRIVGAAFLQMASTFVSQRVAEGTWDEFLSDLDNHSRLSTHRSPRRTR